MAGRAAEELVFHSVTTGAANDIEQATKLARAMITQYGMSEKFGLMGLEVAANQFLDDRTVLNCSDATAAEVDHEVMRVLKESYEEAKRILTEHRKALDEIAAFLIEKETITGKEFMEILRKVEREPKAIESEEKNTSGQSMEMSGREGEAKEKEAPAAETEAEIGNTAEAGAETIVEAEKAPETETEAASKMEHASEEK